MKGGGSYSKEYTKPVTESKPLINASAKDPCLDLSFTTSLQYIDIKPLSKVKRGELLVLRMHKTLSRVEALNLDGEVCGAIIHKDLLTIINCINKGHSFYAKVTKLSTESCTIVVQNENS